MKQNEHLFQFSGAAISDASTSEHDYHNERLIWWRTEQQVQIEKAHGLTAIVKVREQAVTGGKRVEVYADITGVQEINWRLQECGNKIDLHRRLADEYQLKAAAYGTQDARTFELDPSDVLYFRLAGGPREE